MPKRILYIHGVSEIGGAEKDLLRLLERFDRQRFEPFIVCPPDGQLVKKLEQLKVPVYPKSLPSWRKLKDTFALPFAAWFLFKLIRDLKINLVHANDYWWGPISYIASRMAQVPCVVHIRQEVESPRIKQYWFKKPAKMIAVSDRIRNVVVESGVDPTRVTVIYSGINTSLAVDPDAGKKIREQYRLTDNQPVIGTVANLFQRKGYEYLISSIVEVRRKIPDLHCLIIGEGDPDYYALLTEMVQKQGLSRAITFTGFQSAVLAHIAAMDIFVLPSLMEGFGIVLLEAMMMGKPIVATNVGGIPEIVDNMVTGFLVPPRDSSALAQKILCLLESRNLREQLGRKGKSRVVELFSINRTVAQIETLYRELTA